MARKVIGPTGSRRRRWLLLCTTMAAITAAVVFIPSAFAVHASGIFQLDQDASQSLSTNGNTGFEDWDNICAAHLGGATNTPGEFCHKSPTAPTPFPTGTVADKSVFVTDSCCSASSDNIYK